MKQYKIDPDKIVSLDEWDANDVGEFGEKRAEAEAKTATLNDELEELQELLYAEQKHKVLIVLQAMDTGGKDGVIRHVFGGVNPQGVRVASFKVPTPVELAHDYLWRIHSQTPGKGELVIFNRSHYEDVLVVRVHKLVPEEVWRRRYDQINHFERLLFEEGTTILKFYLHIDKKEQKGRLQARLEDPKKQWKFNIGDLDERKLWGEYMRAYEDVLSKTSTRWAPWYIVPANRKWYRNLVIVSILVKTLRSLNMEYPVPSQDLSGIVIED